MRPWLFVLTGLMLFDCSPSSKLDDDDDDDWDEADADVDADSDADADDSCDASLTLSFPDGTHTTLDYCVASSIDAEYEYDPDEAPKIRNPQLRFDATVEEGFECWVKISEPGVCGAGYYCLEESTGSVTFNTRDCVGTGNEYEDTYTATSGYVRLDTLYAGDEPGNFSGEPLATTLAGLLDVTTFDGINLSGVFSKTQDVVANDAEEAVCIVQESEDDCGVEEGDTDTDTDADADADADADTDLDGDDDGWSSSEGDCDDADPYVNPGISSDTCDGIDNDCDSYIDEDFDGDVYEPNDVEATDLGDLSEAGSMTVSAYIFPSSDEDIYRFYVADGWLDYFGLELTLSDIPDDATYALELVRDGHGTVAEEFGGPGDTVELYHDGGMTDDSGYYEATVRSLAGEDCSEPYRLELRSVW